VAGTERFDARDREDLARRGIPVAEAERQLDQLRDPPAPLRLERACTVGDGIERIAATEQQRLAGLADRCRAQGRWMRFVPASGAASRMFQDLVTALAALPARSSGDEWSAIPAACRRGVEEFVAGLPRFAFQPALAGVLERHGASLAELTARGSLRPVLAALLEPEGLGYASLPKALVAFHQADDGPRTAFDEQLVEALPLVTGDDRRARFHFTIAAGHETGFAAALDRIRPRLEAGGARLDVRFSHQAPSTDTLAGESDGRPARDAAGRLLFRPAGHGALLHNLQESGADCVFVKNIDNVAIDAAKPAGRWWARVLAGLAEELAGAIAIHRARLDDGADTAAVPDAIAFARQRFGVEPDPAVAGSERDRTIALLERPLRVCGMVPNTGEPGGGPFWVRDPGGTVSRQIVESAQVDPRLPQQRSVFAGGTHFNPVFLACVLRDPHGAPFDLARFVDPEAVILTRKAAHGRERIALERPGLWNGSMAKWLTVFVEVPGTVFTPVKTVLDLLRPEHQPPD
jgi:hypothetical protein